MPQEGYSAIGLNVDVVGVAAALAGAIVILLDLCLEDIEVGNALSGCVDADDGLLLPQWNLPRRGMLSRGKARY